MNKVRFCDDESINEICNERLINVIGNLGNMSLNEIFNVDGSELHIVDHNFSCKAIVDNLFIDINIRKSADRDTQCYDKKELSDFDKAMKSLHKNTILTEDVDNK